MTVNSILYGFVFWDMEIPNIFLSCEEFWTTFWTPKTGRYGLMTLQLFFVSFIIHKIFSPKISFQKIFWFGSVWFQNLRYGKMSIQILGSKFDSYYETIWLPSKLSIAGVDKFQNFKVCNNLFLLITQKMCQILNDRQ